MNVEKRQKAIVSVCQFIFFSISTTYMRDVYSGDKVKGKKYNEKINVATTALFSCPIKAIKDKYAKSWLVS